MFRTHRGGGNRVADVAFRYSERGSWENVGRPFTNLLRHCEKRCLVTEGQLPVRAVFPCVVRRISEVLTRSIQLSGPPNLKEHQR